ncbi:hypothetical protein [Macrococcus sp. S115]|uniref:hypothetical protein n=1 Tax=Macrococcus sp. S115 TaxID=3047480 RepID=UPI0024BCD439|nr:hypothetical protein [Macrococcus sp. S115]MDJ1111447.1 hypothetical protein [Macrococcus sp. S115]
MIKTGDYIKHKDNGMIYKVVSSSEKLLYVTDFKQTWQHIGVDVATNNFIVVDYKQLYEQQKQRAAEAEKRWSELKETLLLYKDVPQRTQSFDTVFELMREMEFKKENNNA